MTSIQTEIETQLATAEPGVEVLLAEVVGGNVLRLYIDHPDGVSLELCERVTKHLSELRESYALEVSSPGIKRPLTKPEHFKRFLGSKVRVRARVEIAAGEGEDAPTHRTFSGDLLSATERDITVAAESGVVSIAYTDIQRSNLLGD